MDFELTSGQHALRQKIADFCARECPPEFETSLDEGGAFPEDLYRKMADSGFLKISFRQNTAEQTGISSTSCSFRSSSPGTAIPLCTCTS